jgi:hypothetical protein
MLIIDSVYFCRNVTHLVFTELEIFRSVK